MTDCCVDADRKAHPDRSEKGQTQPGGARFMALPHSEHARAPNTVNFDRTDWNAYDAPLSSE